MAESYQSPNQKTINEANKVPRRNVDGRLYQTLEYPSKGGLGSYRYPHFAIFYINANSRSKLIKGNEGDIKTNDDIDLSTKTQGTSASKVLAKSDIVAKITGVEGGVVSHKRILNAICLPMPMKVGGQYSAEYTSTEELGMLGAFMTAASSGQGASGAASNAASLLKQTAIPGLISAGSSVIQQLAASGAAAAGKFIPGAAAVGKAISNAQPLNPKLLEQLNSKFMGTVLNKRQEQLFQSMRFRTHQMSWLFLPRSKVESDTLFDIIKMFKENMHPELDTSTGNSTLIMPSEFDVEFRTGEEENIRVNRIATCVLNSCSVDYTAVGEFITFSGYPDPIAISLDMSFTEVEPLSRNMIANNF